MAEVKISALGSATSLAGTEAVPVVQSGVTRKTTTQDIANLLQPAINVVSQALSVEQSARAADIKRLSDQVSNIISAGGGAVSVTSAALQTVSVNANFHANVISLNLEVEIANRLSAISSPSARTTAGASVHGLQSIFDALSGRISAVVAGAVSVTSAELSLLQNTSVLNSAGNSVKGRQSVFNALSARISDVEAHASTASLAATSANLHANAASDAATSVLRIITSASTRSVGNVSTHGLQSILNALSNRICANSAGGASVTSADLLSAVNNASARNSAGTSVHGLQSVFNAFSGRISDIIAGTFSVNSTDLSAVSALAKQSISVISAALVTETNDRTSADAVLLFRISVVSANLDTEIARATSVENAVSKLLSVAAINTNAALCAISNAIVSVNAAHTSLVCAHVSLADRVSALSAVGGPVSVTSAQLSTYVSLKVSALNKASVRNTAAVSVQGHQSVLNALSAKIAAGGGGSGSVTSTKVSVAVAAESALRNTLSVLFSDLVSAHNALSGTVSQRIVSLAALSEKVSQLSVNINVASLAATSADAHADLASAAATSVNGRATSLETRLSTLSAEFVSLHGVVSNALSAGDVVSNQISTISARVQVLSAGIGSVQLNRLQTTATISAGTLTKISGMSCQLVSGGTYQIHAVLHHSHSTQATNGFGFGVSATTPAAATGVWRGFTSVVQPASAIFGYFNQAGLGSITFSAPGVAASATMYRTELDMDVVSAVSARLQLKARTSATGVGAIDIRAGSYIQAFRIG